MILSLAVITAWTLGRTCDLILTLILRTLFWWGDRLRTDLSRHEHVVRKVLPDSPWQVINERHDERLRTLDRTARP
jgi:hypothetical protein